MYTDTPEFLSTSLHIITAIATPLHILGTYCILFQTPKSMSSVKWAMMNFHFCCMISDWSITVLTVPFVFFPALAGFPLGILVDFGVGMDVQTYLVMTLLSAVHSSIILILENRYFIMFAKETKWKHFRILLHFINYLSSAVYFLPALLTVPDQQFALEQVHRKFPQITFFLHERQIYVFAIDFFWVLMPVNVLVIFNLIVWYSLLTLISRNMKEAMALATYSENTLKMQKKFLRSMYIQAAVFLINIQVPLVYNVIILVTGHYNQSLNNMTFIFLSLHGLSSTVVMICLHKPYREFCGGLIGMVKKRIPRRPIVSVVIVSNQS